MKDSSRQYIYSTFNNEVMVIVYAYSSILAAIKISKIIKKKNFTFNHTRTNLTFKAANDGAFLKIYSV